MIHQLICENKILDRAVIVISLRTLKYEQLPGGFTDKEPVSTSTVAYYVIAKDMAQKLIQTNLFYSSDYTDENQISFILQEKIPDIIRRKVQTGRIKFMLSPSELEQDLKAVFGKYGSSMPVYRFECDQTLGDIFNVKTANGIKQKIYGIWYGRGIKNNNKHISAKDFANKMSSFDSCGKLDLILPSDKNPKKCIVFKNKKEMLRAEDSVTRNIKKEFIIAFKAMFPQFANKLDVICYKENEKIIIAFNIADCISKQDKNDIMHFAAEFGCCDPEECDNKLSDLSNFRVYFYYNGLDQFTYLNENNNNSAPIYVKITDELPHKYWLGSVRKMHDLKHIDGGCKVCAFTSDKPFNNIRANKVKKLIAPGTEIINEGRTYIVKKIDNNDSNIVVEAYRSLKENEFECYFPSRLIERLNGPCHLPRRDELMFQKWLHENNLNKIDFDILSEEIWSSEPAFGESCECIKVLIKNR